MIPFLPELPARPGPTLAPPQPLAPVSVGETGWDFAALLGAVQSLRTPYGAPFAEQSGAPDAAPGFSAQPSAVALAPLALPEAGAGEAPMMPGGTILPQDGADLPQAERPLPPSVQAAKALPDARAPAPAIPPVALSPVTLPADDDLPDDGAEPDAPLQELALPGDAVPGAAVLSPPLAAPPVPPEVAAVIAPRLTAPQADRPALRPTLDAAARQPSPVPVDTTAGGEAPRPVRLSEEAALASAPSPQPAAQPTAQPSAPALPAAATGPALPAPADPAASRSPVPQMESAIAQFGEIREALRAVRPEMTVRHAEFGLVSLRIEQAAPESWRAVLASRDPGFVPAIQAALAERAVLAASAADGGSLAGHSGTGHNGTGDPRSGSSPSGGHGSSQPYLGQSGARDGEAAPDQRRPSTAAALSARAGSEDGPASTASPANGVFA